MLLIKYLKNKGYLDFLDDKKQIKTDFLSGLTVALALIPEAIAFSFVAGIPPMVGLHAAFIVGLITAVFGGRPGMISGATGALAVVMVSLVSEHGIEYLYAALILMGILQILFGVLGGGKLVRLIPHPVMLGFVNGLAIIIFMSQLGQFKVGGEWIAGTSFIIMLLLIALTMAIIHFLPKFTKAVPSGLVAIVGITLLVYFIPALDGVRTVSSYLLENGYDELAGGFLIFHIPEIQGSFIDMLKIIFPYSLILATIGLTESLMTLTLIDEVTDTRGKPNKEAVGQGVANTVCGFFSAMGGCAMIGQSMINISGGGRGRLSGITAAVALILFIIFGTAFISIIPLAALVGLMFIVVIGTFAWPTLKMLNKIPKTDAFVIIAVTFITVYTGDLAIAVMSGIIISALVFAWKKSQDIHVKRYVDKKGTTHYDLEGPLFFASVTRFKTLFDIKNDTKEIIIDFADSKVMDHSAIEAIDFLTERYLKEGKILHLRHLSSDCRKLIKNAKEIVDINVIEDPKYHVADDLLG